MVRGTRRRSACSSTASSSRQRRASGSTTSTRPPRRCSARSPTRPTSDMQRAIAAARRAFDETDWSTEPRAAQALPRAAAGGARGRARGAARGADRRGRRAPACSPTARSSTRRSTTALRYPAKMIDEFPWERDAARRRDVRHHAAHAVSGRSRSASSARSCRGTSRSRSRSTRSARSLATGQHDRAQAGARHAVERHPARPARRREDRHPGRACSTSSRRPTTSSAKSSRSRRTVDMISFTGSTVDRQADHGEGRGHAQAGVPRARRQVGDDRARRRRLPDGRAQRLDGVHARRSGLRDADADAAAALPLRRGRRAGRAGHGVRCPTATRPTRT